MRWIGSGLFAVFSLLSVAPHAIAQDVDAALTERMLQEAAARKACKVAICDAARNKKTAGGDIACSVVKTWTAPTLKEQILKGRLDWPWGHAQCKADIKLERAFVARVLSGEAVEGKLPKHAVRCTLDQKDGQEKYDVKFLIQPTVKFEGAKATKATLNWSDIDGSLLARSAVWSTATLDNNLGVLEGATVEAINNFFSASCDEVKDELGK